MRFQGCPAKGAAEYGDFIMYFAQLQNGILPANVGFDNHPAPFVMAMTVIGNMANTKAQEEASRHRAEAKAAAKQGRR